MVVSNRDYCFRQCHDIVDKLEDTTDSTLQMETQLKHMNSSIQALVQLQNKIKSAR